MKPWREALTEQEARDLIAVEQDGHANICQVHTAIYRQAWKLPPSEEKDLILFLATKGFIYGKKMSNKLRHHNKEKGFE